jgi:putative restriction endonuclease
MRWTGLYLWSRRRKSNGERNAFYEFMREVSPGDIVFSFRDTVIAAVGIARSFCYESPKPVEFGATGTNWGTIGWRVEVTFQERTHRVRPKEHMDRLGGFLPAKYSPLTPGGNGLQSVYLTEIAAGFAFVLFGLIGHEASSVADNARTIAVSEPTNATPEMGLDEWEKREVSRILTGREMQRVRRALQRTPRPFM